MKKLSNTHVNEIISKRIKQNIFYEREFGFNFFNKFFLWEKISELEFFKNFSFNENELEIQIYPIYRKDSLIRD